MPFLPTLVVVGILGVASLYCPSSQPALREAHAAPTSPAAPSTTDFAKVATVAAPAPESAPTRLPAAQAFAEAFPLDLSAPAAQSVTAPARPALAARATAHVAVAGRHACPGRRCPETPPRVTDPMAAGRAEASEPEEAGLLPPAALPFAAAVAERLGPAARAVGDAANLVRDGAAAMKGSVALVVADCLR